LLAYITKMPPADANHTRGHRYPYIASEVFGTEMSSIIEQFFES